MKNSNQIKTIIAKQEKLVERLKKQSKADYKNHSMNMLVSQAEYFIARDVLRALETVLPQITEHQENINFYNC